MRPFPPLLLFAALLVLSSTGACDAPFEPYAETDRVFSVFGLLNPAREQQRVRVEVLQDGKPFGADSAIGARVTLTRLATGRTVALQNEVIALRGRKHNFVTGQMNVRLDETYRLAVRRRSGNAGGAGSAEDVGNAATTATTTTPHEVPQLSLSRPFGLEATVEGGTEDELLFLGVDYHTVATEPADCDPSEDFCNSYERTFEAQYAERARRTPAGYTVTFDWKADVDSLFTGPESTFRLEQVDVRVGLVHPSTPTYDGLSYEALFRPEVGPSNVERGVGFVAGVTVDTALVRIPPGRRPVTVAF